jgi:hypothetical protein
MDMKGKFRLYYDFNCYNDTHPYEAILELSNEVSLNGHGDSFEEAKAKVIERARSIPEDEEVIL